MCRVNVVCPEGGARGKLDGVYPLRSVKVLRVIFMTNWLLDSNIFKYKWKVCSDGVDGEKVGGSLAGDYQDPHTHLVQVFPGSLGSKELRSNLGPELDRVQIILGPINMSNTSVDLSVLSISAGDILGNQQHT